jgi:hypothetical protein
LLSQVQALIKTQHPVEKLPSRASDIRSIALCPDRLLKMVPDFQFTPLHQGLRRTLADHGVV